MLDGNNVNDIKKISNYGKASGFLIAKRYNLPTYSNFYIIENEEEVQALLDTFNDQNEFCMRSDTQVGSIPIGIGGRNGNRYTIFEYIKQIKEQSQRLGTKGVAIIYWNKGKFCPTYDVEGCFYLDYQTKKQLMIDYVGKGWDGSFLSHGSACHETYTIPWNEILFLNDNNISKYKTSKIGEYAYNQLRDARIKDLQIKYGLPSEECSQLIPSQYQGIKKEYIRQVIDQVIIPMYDSPDLQRNYREYIPIAQIENGKVLVPEVILPSRLKYMQRGMQYDER